MAQSTILAAGITAATSTDVVVAAGEVVSVGLFFAPSQFLPLSIGLRVVMDTPDADLGIVQLDNQNRAIAISGPGTFRVVRPAYTGSAVGVFLEQAAP